MKLFTRLSVILLFACLLSGSMFAGDEDMKVEHKVGGTVQSWVSYQAADSAFLGFGLRRVRARWYATINSKFKTMVQAELTDPKLLDARLEYHFSKQFNVRMGRFVGAGVRGGGLTSHSQIDIVERPRVANYWAARTIGSDFRDYGVQAEAKSATGEYAGRVFFHNGSGAANVISHERTSPREAQLRDIAADVMVIAAPKSVEGLEVGGHFGVGNKDVKEWTSYSGYAYYEPGPFRLKAELVGLVDKSGAEDVTTMGYYVFGGFEVTPNIEIVGRFETFDPNTDVDEDGVNDITAGFVYKQFSGKVNHKLTAAIVIPSEQGESVKNTAFYTVWQIVF
ncbi:MAG: hypothetical protein H6629_01730 [Calditrichae bacterium]|nr:hypothetical protein [Calditrichia bacterium]